MFAYVILSLLLLKNVINIDIKNIILNEKIHPLVINYYKSINFNLTNNELKVKIIIISIFFL